MRLIILIFTFFVLGFQFFGYSQQVTVSLNKNNILIGEQINLAIKISVSNSDAQVNFNIPDSIPHFEIISNNNPEKILSDQSSIQKVIVFTSFDSGAYTFPSIKVDLRENGKFTELYSPSILITVGYAKEDSTGIRDLKPLRMVKVESKLWVYIIASLLTLLLLWVLIRYLIKKGRKDKESGNSVNYYQKAIDELDILDKSGVDSKQFHSKLSNIFREYYSLEFKNNLLVQTTGDILIQLKKDGIKDDVVNEIASPLRLGDAVKYAKYKSKKIDDVQALNSIRNVIIQLNKINAKG